MTKSGMSMKPKIYSAVKCLGNTKTYNKKSSIKLVLIRVVN